MDSMNTLNEITTAHVVVAAASGSPRHSGGQSIGSPQSRRFARAGSSPWTQIVRGELEPIMASPSSPSAASSAAVIEPAVAGAGAGSSSSSSSVLSSVSQVEEYVSVSESSENVGGSNANAGKKPAWKKPSNGEVEVGPVMGAVSWPALSESTRASSKPFSEALKGSSDMSLSDSVSQGTGAATTSSPIQATFHSTANHTVPARQRSMKLYNSNMSSNDSLPQQQAPASQVVETAPSNPFTKDHTQRSGFGSQSHSSSDHPQNRNSFRNRNAGPHTRGDGSHNHSHGGRRNQDHGNQEWNAHRNPNGRGSYMQHQRLPRYPRGSTPRYGSTQFSPPPTRPYNPMVFPDLGPVPQLFYVPVPHPDSLRMPFVAPLPPPLYSDPVFQLPTKIVNQIDYYFSNENLIKDTYLRQNMDELGWVPIKLIAGFKKVMELTDNIEIILDSLRMSTVVEVQGGKVRRRNDWDRWIMHPVQFPNVSTLQSPSSPQTAVKTGHDVLAARMDNIVLEDNAGHMNMQANSQPQLSGGDKMDQFSVQGGSDHTISARN